MRKHSNSFTCNFFIFLFLTILFLFNSCAYKKVAHYPSENFKISLFIQMPENVLVFENISTIVYKGLWDHFNRAGYNLVDSEKDAFLLKIKIKKLDFIHKFISPEVLMYGSKIRLELYCQLFDNDGGLLAEKMFPFSHVVSKSKNPIINSSFFEFEQRRLIRRAAPKIEQYFRSYFKLETK